MGDNEIFSPANMLCMNEEVASGELFQTAIREDDEYNNSDEPLSLPKTKNEKVNYTIFTVHCRPAFISFITGNLQLGLISF